MPSKVETGKQAVDLTLTIDGAPKTATLSGDNGVIIAHGTKSNITITITLSNSGISVQAISIEDWNVVEVGGHKVTVKLDETVEDIEKDILISAYNDGDAAKFFCRDNRILRGAVGVYMAAQNLQIMIVKS